MRHGELALAARIAVTIPYVWLRVRLLPLPRALAGLMPGKRKGVVGGWWLVIRSGTNHQPPTTNHAFPRPSEASHIIRITDRVLERRVALLRPSCMLRSLVLFRFLRAAGLPVCVHFGVAREEGRLKGHSWLTLEGLPYAEAADPSSRFSVVYSYPDS